MCASVYLGKNKTKGKTRKIDIELSIISGISFISVYAHYISFIILYGHIPLFHTQFFFMKN